MRGPALGVVSPAWQEVEGTDIRKARVMPLTIISNPMRKKDPTRARYSWLSSS